MENKTKAKIKEMVKNYKKLFPEEFALVVEQIKLNRKTQRDKFATLQKTVFVERALIETPETLNTMFNLRLTDKEKKEFGSKKGVRWFAKTFPMFKLAEKV